MGTDVTDNDTEAMKLAFFAIFGVFAQENAAPVDERAKLSKFKCKGQALPSLSCDGECKKGFPKYETHFGAPCVYERIKNKIRKIRKKFRYFKNLLTDKKNPENPENFKCRVVCGPGYQPMQRRMKCHSKNGWKRYPGPYIKCRVKNQRVIGTSNGFLDALSDPQ